MTSPVCGLKKKKKDTNELTYITKHKETHRLRKRAILPGEGIVRELEVVMYTLMYLKWITNKELLYSTILCGSLDGGKV